MTATMAAPAGFWLISCATVPVIAAMDCPCRQQCGSWLGVRAAALLPVPARKSGLKITATAARATAETQNRAA
jgi:hypothetical protein